MPLRPFAIAPRQAIDAVVSAPAGPASASAEAPSATAVATRALLGCSPWFLIELPPGFYVLAAPPVGAAASYPARELTEPRDGKVHSKRWFRENDRRAENRCEVFRRVYRTVVTSALRARDVLSRSRPLRRSVTFPKRGPHMSHGSRRWSGDVRSTRPGIGVPDGDDGWGTRAVGPGAHGCARASPRTGNADRHRPGQDHRRPADPGQRGGGRSGEASRDRHGRPLHAEARARHLRATHLGAALPARKGHGREGEGE